jgi:hypothetical protein
MKRMAFVVAAIFPLAAVAQFDPGKMMKEMGKQIQKKNDDKQSAPTNPNTPISSDSGSSKATINNSQESQLTKGGVGNKSNAQEIKMREIVFRDLTGSDVNTIKNNKDVLAWASNITKLYGDARKVNGLSISNLIKASNYPGAGGNLVLKAPFPFGKGSEPIPRSVANDESLVITGSVITTIRVGVIESPIYYYIPIMIDGSEFYAIKYKPNSEDIPDLIENIFDEDLTSEAADILTKCPIGEETFREGSYKYMITEGKAKIGSYKVVDYKIGMAPELGWRINVQASKQQIVDAMKKHNPKIKVPFKKKIGQLCNATGDVVEIEKNITQIHCGCNVEPM